MHAELIEKIQTYLVMWAQSDAAERVNAAESLAIAHGLPQYEGRTIPEYIEFMLQDMLVFLSNKPELLQTVITPEQAQARVTKFLEREEEKLNEAARLTAELSRYWLGPLDPRYMRTKKELSKVVKSFRISDENYRLNLPAIHELED